MKTCMASWKLVIVAGAVIVVSSLSTSSALAQRGMGRGMFGGMGNDPSFLLFAEPVQKELELTDDQKSSVQKYQQDMMAEMGNMRGQFQGMSPEERQAKMAEIGKDHRKKIADILLQPQMDRLDEISLQWGMQQGAAGTLSRDDIATKLTLTDDQKSKLKDIGDESQAKVMELFSNGPPADDQERQDRQKKMQEFGTEQKDKSLAVLTDEQKTKLEKLKGKTFDLSGIQMPGRGFGRGRGGPGGAGGTPPAAQPGA
jgi:Spy/CpxP family protein refolding chaperone